MDLLDRITHNPEMMGGRACIRGLRTPVVTIIGMLASGYSTAQLLELNPFLEEPDIRAALAFATVLLDREVDEVEYESASERQE